MSPLPLARSARFALSAAMLLCAAACYVEFIDDDLPVTIHLTASVVSPTQIDLFWTPHPDPVTGYDLYRNGVAATPCHLSSTSFYDNDLMPGTQYCYRVYAVVWPFGYDGISNLACATTPTIPSATSTSLQDAQTAEPVDPQP